LILDVPGPGTYR